MRTIGGALPGFLGCAAALLLATLGPGPTEAAVPDAAASTGAVASPDAAASPGPKSTAFEDVAVIAMDSEKALPHQTVIVRDGRIFSIGPARTVHVPAGVRRV